MPASSRKRNKGRDRKAKKAAEKKEAVRIMAYNRWCNWARGEGFVNCNHGLVTTLPDLSHPVSSFITEYFLSDDIKDTLQTHAEALSDSHRKLAVHILKNIGANFMLCKIGDGREVAFALLVLEKYGESPVRDFDLTTRSRDVTKKAGCLTMSGTDRDLLKFYRKRMSCKCLKKMHLEARKTQPKLGLCENCKEVKERRLLMVCSKCRISQYCSRKCQIAVSSEHRLHCDLRVRAEQIVGK